MRIGVDNHSKITVLHFNFERHKIAVDDQLFFPDDIKKVISLAGAVSRSFPQYWRRAINELNLSPNNRLQAVPGNTDNQLRLSAASQTDTEKFDIFEFLLENWKMLILEPKGYVKICI